MIEVKNDFVKKYKYGDYLIYIKSFDSHYECYLQNIYYGVLDLMVGLDLHKGQVESLEDYIQLIENNIKEYIQDYKKMYED